MTAVVDILERLGGLGCQAIVEGEGIRVVGPTERIPSDLMAEARRTKLAIRLVLLRNQGEKLAAFIDGDTPLSERQAHLPELMALQEKIAVAQEDLWAAWRREGFTILWSPLVEEFVLVGDSTPPPGSEGYAVYTWAEVAALKDAAPERVVAAHKIKKAFSGMVRCDEHNR